MARGIDKIKEISSKKVDIIFDTLTPLGLFIRRDGDMWIGIDNSTGEAWTEEFTDRKTCVAWLRGEFEMSDYLEGDVK